MTPKTAASALAVTLLAAGCGSPVSSHSPQPPSSEATAWHAHPTRVSRTLHRPSPPARTRPQTRVPTAAPPVQQRGGAGAVFGAWSTRRGTWRVFNCESHWNPKAVSASGKYRGLIQADAPFWAACGGLHYAARPDLASVQQQLAVAYHAWTRRGWSPWPTCGRLA